MTQRKLLLRTVTVAALALAAVVAQADPNIGAPASDPKTPGAVITIETDRAQYFLGENAILNFHVRNTGDKPFDVFIGCDWEAGYRETGFHVTAVDEHGRSVIDPSPTNTSMGGLGNNQTVSNDKDLWSNLPLASYLTIDHPGTYTITVSHVLGGNALPGADWQEDLHSHAGRPAATVTVSFVDPSPEQAAQVLGRMKLLPKDPFGDFGNRGRGYQNYAIVREPVYLPLLTAAAKTDAGTAYENDVIGIGSIATLDATRELIALMGDTIPDRAAFAAKTLSERLVSPQFRKNATSSTYWAQKLAARQAIQDRTWSADLVPPAVANALNLLKSGDSAAAVAAAKIVDALGDQASLPIVVAKLDSLLTLNIKSSPHSDPEGPGYACDELVEVGRSLVERGAVLPPGERTDGDRLVEVSLMRFRPNGLPVDWESLVDKLVSSPNEMVRSQCLTMMDASKYRETFFAHLAPVVPKLLADDDYNVRQVAVDAAEKLGDPALKPNLLSLLRSNSDAYMPYALSRALAACGGRWDALSVMIDQAQDQATVSQTIELLASLTQSHVNNENVSTADLPAYKAKWRAFIDKHKAQIQAGQFFANPDPEVVALFPADYK